MNESYNEVLLARVADADAEMSAGNRDDLQQNFNCLIELLGRVANHIANEPNWGKEETAYNVNRLGVDIAALGLRLAQWGWDEPSISVGNK